MARILITEDERIIAEDLKLILQTYGHEIIGIESKGENAISKAKESTPDIIFMDIKLEGSITGIEAASEIRKSIDTAIIFCTAYSDDLTLLQVSALSADGYIAKPFQEEDILSCVKHVTNTFSNSFRQHLCSYHSSALELCTC